jgi:low affinity Fe/Cu permease
MKNGGKPKTAGVSEWFSHLAAKASATLGSATAFLLAIAVVVIWAFTGPMYGYSNAWQLVINTGTTIVTFLMVFLIQNTQNRDAKAIHLKLNELIHAITKAHNELIDVEDLSDQELQHLHEHYAHIREEYERRQSRRGSDSKSDAKIKKTA